MWNSHSCFVWFKVEHFQHVVQKTLNIFTPSHLNIYLTFNVHLQNQLPLLIAKTAGFIIIALAFLIVASVAPLASPSTTTFSQHT